MTDKATPRPWKRGASDLVIAELSPDCPSLVCHGSVPEGMPADQRPLSERYANADLIVRAVNAHDALVAVCEELLAVAEEEYASYWEDMADKLRAALALARKDWTK